MPSHASVLRSSDRSDIERCKQQMATIFNRRGGYLLDFRIEFALTRNDTNFWDENHFRVRLAQALILRIKEAIGHKHNAEDASYLVLAAPPAAISSTDSSPDQ